MRKFLIYITIISFLIHGCKEDSDPSQEKPDFLPDNYISAIFIDANGIKYFATKKGLTSFDDIKWVVYDTNPKIKSEAIHNLGFEQSYNKSELWMGTNNGVTVASLPIDAVSEATTYTESNTQILFPDQPGLVGDSVFVVKVDDKNIRWFGTQEGISAFSESTWFSINWGNHYNPPFFNNNRITSLDYTNDTIYVGTMGGGVARMVANTTDAVSAASPFEIPWSLIASNNILAVFTDGTTQWFGTDQGVTKHIGTKAKLNWESFYKDDGLVNNYVQCINKDLTGNMWFGTKEGISMFNGSQWTSYTTADGLIGNNILCIGIDLDNSIWIGTDSGISHFSNKTWVNYKTVL